MVEIDQNGLFIVEGGEVTHIHTSGKYDDNLDALRDYLEEWELEI